MAEEPVRAAADWLALREPADAEARDRALVDRLLGLLPDRRPLEVRDLGCGTGSMVRWLSPQLPAPQHWVLVDRDPTLLPLVPHVGSDGTAPAGVAVLEPRLGDVTRLAPEELADADLVTASALLDMMTASEVERFVAGAAAPGCPVLVALSVTGRVRLTPAEPADRRVAEAFDGHQRRLAGGEPRLGPDAAAAAVAAFERRGRTVVTAPSPWRLGPERRALAGAWLDGWLDAAFEQEPPLAEELRDYATRRRRQVGQGLLSVEVGHIDLLVLPV